MPAFHIELHGTLSKLTDSGSIDIETSADEIDGDDLKAQLAIVLGAKNPREADDIEKSIEQSVWTTDVDVLPENTKLRQGNYGLRPKPA